jgi:hypothetical protein
VRDNPRQWDLALPQANFSLSSNKNIYVGKYAFKIVYSANPEGIVDLVDLPANTYNNSDASDFVENICEVHQQVKHKLKSMNDQYR